MAVAAMANGASKPCYSYSTYHLLLFKPTKKRLMVSPKFFINTQNFSSNVTLKVPFPIQASNSPREEETSTIDNTNAITQDLNYVWKLGAGSVGGAVVIKYGSILFPEITRPNILQALIMVSAPVIVAIVLLVKQSRLSNTFHHRIIIMYWLRT